MGGGWRGHGSIPGRTRRPPLRKRSCYDSIFIQLGDEILQLGVDRMRLCGYFVVVLIGVLVSIPVTAQRSLVGAGRIQGICAWCSGEETGRGKFLSGGYDKTTI